MSEEELIHVPRGGASFNRGSSEQNYQTPKNLRDAIVKRFGAPEWDLAADNINRFAPPDCYFSEAQNSLEQDWRSLDGLLFLNPPFANITPWARKCYLSCLGRPGKGILFLVPASVGSNWFRDNIHNQARVIFLNGRVPFKPDKPKWGFPKDIMLVHFGHRPYYEVWDWRGLK